MTTTHVLLEIRCTADDPQAPARVLGIFAARSMRPMRFFCALKSSDEQFEIEVELSECAQDDAAHLARLIERMPVISEVALMIGGETLDFSWSACPNADES